LMSVPLHQERVISFYKFPDEFSGHYGAGQDVHFQPRIQRKRKVHKTQMCIGRGQAGGGRRKRRDKGWPFRKISAEGLVFPGRYAY
jgi:hypothetical protein